LGSYSNYFSKFCGIQNQWIDFNKSKIDCTKEKINGNEIRFGDEDEDNMLGFDVLE